MKAGSPIPLTCQPKCPPVPFLRCSKQRKVTALRAENLLLPRAQEPICALLGLVPLFGLRFFNDGAVFPYDNLQL